jgi:DNA-binding NarL/FixJ family response regulator
MLEKNLVNKMNRKENAVASSNKQIRVLLAEDNALFRKSLKALIELKGDIKVIGQAKNGLEAVRMAKKLHPNVVVTDIAMPQLNGLQASKQIVEDSPTIRVLILSAHADAEYIKQSVLCGASGYLIKQSSPQVLAQAIREVFKGNSFFCAPIAKPLRDQCRKIFGKGELKKKRSALQSLSDVAS